MAKHKQRKLVPKGLTKKKMKRLKKYLYQKTIVPAKRKAPKDKLYRKLLEKHHLIGN